MFQRGQDRRQDDYFQLTADRRCPARGPSGRHPTRSGRLVKTALAIALIAICGALGQASATEVTEGAMCYTDPNTGEERRLPLEHTAVSAAVSGSVAEVTVTQVFSNPLADRMEAVYVFPLPDRAAVDRMSIRVGERLLEGEIHRRQEAREIYERARAEGRLTGLLDQERANIFTQRVANLLPGETIEVVIHYVEDVHFDHGTWRFVFPTVVGPRYIPGSPTGRSSGGWSPDTDRVPDASRITPPVLAPGHRSGHDIAITVDLEPGFAMRAIASSSHDVRLERRGDSRATVTLTERDTIPNKDFVLTWSTASAWVQPALVTHKVAEAGYLTLILQPPARPRAEQVVPREVVFVLDTSGSMSGEPLAACKQLARKALRRLREDDTFRMIRFAGAADQLNPDALPATRVNIERGLSYLDGMRGGGGTEMLAGVRAALDAAKDPYRLRMVLFLTDGYIGNEAEILRRVGGSIGSSRIFSFGVGSSVNRYLLDRLAETGRGVAEYLRPGESPQELVDRFFARITDPVFTELEIDWGGLDVFEVEPPRVPDLFAAQPLLVHARYRGGGAGTVSLRGWAGTERIELSTDVRLPRREKDNEAQARLWARARIARLELAKLRSAEADRLVDEITSLALEHRLMTAYTSFVVVDRSQVREGGELVTIDQPVPMPEGVSYEGVFGQKQARVRANVLGSPAGAARKRVYTVRQVRIAPSPAKNVPIPDPTPVEPAALPETLRDDVRAVPAYGDAAILVPRGSSVRTTEEAERVASAPPGIATGGEDATAAPEPIARQQAVPGTDVGTSAPRTGDPLPTSGAEVNRAAAPAGPARPEHPAVNAEPSQPVQAALILGVGILLLLITAGIVLVRRVVV